MKYYIIILATAIANITHAQKIKIYKKDSIWINRTKKEINWLPDTNVNSAINETRLPFSHFIFTDVRADTSYIAVKTLHDALSRSKSFDKVAMQGGTSASLSQYLNNNSLLLFEKNGYTLKCYIKQLRTIEIDSFNTATNNSDLFRRINFEIEGYLQKDNVYYPAVKIDTTALFLFNKRDFWQLHDLVNQFAFKAASIDTARVFKRKGYNNEDLEKKYRQTYSKPILQDSKLNAGVYKNFEEFVNNNPSILEYEFKIDKKGAMLYTARDGQAKSPERKAFGFCDGKVLWIRVENSFCPLIRQGNTFELLYVKYQTSTRSIHYVPSGGAFGSAGPITAIGSTIVATALGNAMTEDPSEKMVYQLNMENGSYY